MSNDMHHLFKPNIMVTGFGPFPYYPVNASWEAVKRLNKEKIERKHNCELTLFEIPIIYEFVDNIVPALWEAHSPKLMMHVGVSSIAECLTVETQAHKKGYKIFDSLDKCPVNFVCPADGAKRIQTKLNVEALCREFNDANPPDEKTSAVVSKEAGRYLCEYIYYTSLCVDNTRTIFVHVPDTNVYSPEQTARDLERIIDICLQQINQAENTKRLTEKPNDANLNDQECNEV